MKKNILRRLGLSVSLALLGVGVSLTTLSLSSCSSNEDNTNKSSSDKTSGSQNQTPSQPSKPNNTSPDSYVLNKQGGSLNNLNVSNYLEVVKTLNLAQDTVLNELSNDVLNDRLHQNNSFKDLNLSLVDGSDTKLGKLVLTLNGSYKNQVINNEPITITNFNRLEDTYWISSVQLDYINWFNNKQPMMQCPKNDVITTNPDIAKTLISDFKFNYSNQVLSYSQFKSKYPINTVSIKRYGNTVSFSLDFNVSYYQYNNGQWNKNTFSPQMQTNKNNSTIIPNVHDLEKAILDQLVPDQEKLNKVYPSMFLGKLVYEFSFPTDNKSTTLNPIRGYFKNDKQLLESYKSYWDSNVEYEAYLYLVANTTSDMIANDKTGELTFNMSMEINQGVPTKRAVKQFNFHCNSIQQFINDNKDKPNQITILNNIKDNKIDKKEDLSKIINEQLRTQINQVNSSNPSLSTTLNTASINKTFFNCTGIENNKNNQFSYNSYIPSLFGYQIEQDRFGGGMAPSSKPYFDTESGLFSYNGSTLSSFYISDIQLKIEPNVPVTISFNPTTNKKTISYQAKLMLNLQGYDTPYEMDSTFSLTLD